MVIWQPSGRFHTKILDYGLSKFSPKPEIQTSIQDGTVMGSILFMAPEQFEREELCERTDLYSIGCVYYHSLSGQYPYNGQTNADIMNSHLEHRVTPLEDLRPDLAPSVCQWVMWLINRAPDNRPTNAHEALERLPMHPDRVHQQVLQEITVEKTGKVKTIAISAVPIPVQGANTPTGFVIVRGGLSENDGKKGSTTTLLIGKPGVKPKPRNQPKSDRVGRKLVLVVVRLAAVVAVYLIALSAISFKHEADLSVIASQRLVAPAPKTINLLLGFIYSKKSTLQQRAVARYAFTRMHGENVDGVLVERIKNEAPTSDARLTLCRILGDRNKEAAVPDLLEATKSAQNQTEYNNILKLAQDIVKSSMTMSSDTKDLTAEENDRNAVLNIYLEKIASMYNAY